MTDSRPLPVLSASPTVGAAAVLTQRPLLIASRGDALTPYLSAALVRRYGRVARLDPELTPVQRYLVAAVTFRPSRPRWVERFYKSGLAYRLRSRNAGRNGSGLRDATVLQVHGLFDVPDARAVLYVDCTHRQSARSWPPWNPLSGPALTRWYNREQMAFQRAAHVFAFSDPTRESLVIDYGVDPANVTVVGAGVNFDQLPTVAHRAPDPVVLFIGNDFVRKGGRVLLEAFRQVRARIPAARLQLVGTPAGVQPQPGVEVLGRVYDRARIAQLYAKAQVFCLPALFDPYPLVLLEAMAHGLPVVSSTSCGIPEMVVDGATGHLLGAGDVDAVAAAMIRLLSAPEEAARLGAAGRTRVEHHFQWDQVIDRMAPVLDLLTGRPSPAPHRQPSRGPTDHPAQVEFMPLAAERCDVHTAITDSSVEA